LVRGPLRPYEGIRKEEKLVQSDSFEMMP
jgi:hypothetical protein